MLDAELLYTACYPRAKNDTTHNFARVLTVQHRDFPTDRRLTWGCHAGVCSFGSGANAGRSNGLVERSAPNRRVVPCQNSIHAENGALLRPPQLEKSELDQELL